MYSYGIFQSEDCDFDEVAAEFPSDFVFGVSTSAYQIEGAWNEDGKGKSIWDASLHDDPTHVIDRSNADTAADSYHHYKDDLAAIKRIGVSDCLLPASALNCFLFVLQFNFYRFSISWTRILPAGDLREVNEKGLQYYHNVIDECLRLGIEPIITMYHLDLPQSLQDLGGWANSIIVQFFKAYADILFQNYGKKVQK